MLGEEKLWAAKKVSASVITRVKRTLVVRLFMYLLLTGQKYERNFPHHFVHITNGTVVIPVNRRLSLLSLDFDSRT